MTTGPSVAEGGMRHSTVYGASPTKRPRRGKVDIERIKSAMLDVLADDHPMTVRQVFYQLVSRKVIEKTEAEYKNTVIRLALELRRSGDLPYDYVADNTRWQRKPTTWDSLADMAKDSARTYRRALWSDSPQRIEIWLEKEALAGVVVDVTDMWDVPLLVTRGYPSESYVYSAAEQIREGAEHGQITHIYYFGDHDPSGLDISRSTQKKLADFVVAPAREAWHRTIEDELARVPREVAWNELEQWWGNIRAGRPAPFPPSLTPATIKSPAPAPWSDYFTFERVAVAPWQITDWNLPTRPTKQTDTRARQFKGESVELDAIPSQRLRDLVSTCITRHVDQEALKRTLSLEKAERESLQRFARRIGRRVA